MSDRIAVLDRGRVVQFGTSDEVRDRSANELVAQLFAGLVIDVVPTILEPTILEKDGQARPDGS